MASDTATAKADPRAEPRRPPLWLRGSRLGRLIVVLNLLGLAVLISGALITNEFRRGLIQARIDSLSTQGELIANVIAGAATVGSPYPMLEGDRAGDIIQLLFIPEGQRARLFDGQGRLLADSYLVADRVEARPLPPPRARGSLRWPWQARNPDQPRPEVAVKAREALAREVGLALEGEPVAQVRRAQSGERVISVSIPVRRVQAVLGVLTLEGSGVDATITAQRKALIPFALVAVGVTLLSSLLLTWLVAHPVLTLAQAADRVRLSRSRSIRLPALAGRDDEIGDLTRSLQDMTDTLSARLDAIESFAADVAHEIRNPLTSIRSASETLPLIKDDAQRERLMGILRQDVDRLDRLITDISNASRLDAELSRDPNRPVELGKLLGDIAAVYAGSTRGKAVEVRLSDEAGEPVYVSGREGPLGQVFRNLIDNARSFSPEGSAVRVTLRRANGEALVTVEDRGPGVPAENLETVFERFYTARPKGAAFGGHSGLGLSIARQIIEAHRGRIWAENVADAQGRRTGARFSVALPAAGA
ncbi:MAG TPA: stimulus-sensing domain-containing protein [Caulobacteraceae bacterium]|jgi:two-component system sensor histidine kinase ChvG